MKTIYTLRSGNNPASYSTIKSFSSWDDAYNYALNEQCTMYTHCDIEIRISEDYKYLVDLHRIVYAPLVLKGKGN